MDLIVNKVMQLQVMHVTDSNSSIEILTCSTITQLNFTITCNRNTLPNASVITVVRQICHNILAKSIFILIVEILFSIGSFFCIKWHVYIIVCKFQCILNINFLCAIKYWCLNIKSQRFRCKTKVNLKDLTDIHSGRHTKWIQYDVKRASVRKIWHIFYW